MHNLPKCSENELHIMPGNYFKEHAVLVRFKLKIYASFNYSPQVIKQPHDMIIRFEMFFCFYEDGVSLHNALQLEVPYVHSSEEQRLPAAEVRHFPLQGQSAVQHQSMLLSLRWLQYPHRVCAAGLVSVP